MCLCVVIRHPELPKQVIVHLMIISQGITNADEKIVRGVTEHPWWYFKQAKKNGIK